MDGIVEVFRFGAARDGVTDNTAAFQAALNVAGRDGSQLFVPPGKYLFKGSLNVPSGVTIQGSFGSVPAHNGLRDPGLPVPGDKGTVFMPVGGRGTEEGAFITLNTNSVLKGVCIYNPEQSSEERPVPYPWTVAMRGKNPALIDVELVNPYNGVDATDNERHIIRNVMGQPLRRGILVDGVYDIGRIEDVHFNPWWSMSPAVMKFMIEEGEGFIFARTDWQYVTNCFAIFYKVGFRFTKFEKGAANVVLTQSGHDIAPTTVLVEHTMAHAGVSFVNCQMMGSLTVAETNRGPVRFTGCGFWGCAPNPDWQVAGTGSIAKLAGTGHVIFSGCHFTTWDKDDKAPGSPALDCDCRSFAVSACEFVDSGKMHVRAGKNVAAGVITGCKTAGNLAVEGPGAEKVQAGLNICI